MTTLTLFNPQSNQVFQFNPTLDGVTYIGQCPFNIFSQRYYLSILDTFGNIILNCPLTGSPDDFSINLAFGYFTSTIVYRVSTGNIEVSP
jgi:hypothetical protein